jgi:hypothetical protein
LELNEDVKQAARELGLALNLMMEQSPEVAEAIARLRALGYMAELALDLHDISELDIGAEESEADDADLELQLTEDDVRTLRQMKIKLDPEE